MLFSHPDQTASLVPDLEALGAVLITMAQFSEVLEQVQSVLAWASPAEVQVLLDGLVEDRIISEACRKTLSLCQLYDGIVPGLACKEASSTMGCDDLDETLFDLNRERIRLEWTDGSEHSVNDQKLDGFGFVSPMDNLYVTKYWQPKRPPHEHVTHRKIPQLLQECLEDAPKDKLYRKGSFQGVFFTPKANDFPFSLRLGDRKAELQSRAEPIQKPVSDSESVNRGNFGNKEEWLKHAEEAAAITIPLWKDYQQGQQTLQAMIPLETTFSSMRDDMVSDREAFHLDWDVEEETDLATACRMLGASTDDSELSETNSSDRAKLEGLYFSTLDLAELNTSRFRVARATGNVSPVEACAGTGTNSSACILEGRPNVFCQDNKTANAMDNLFSLTDAFSRSNSAVPKTTFRHLLSSGAYQDTKTDEYFYSNTCSLTEGIRGDEFRSTACNNGIRDILDSMDLLRGKFYFVLDILY